jgi:hypothetical protein
MRALFVELPAFERLRNEYLDDESFRAMQNALMDDPSAGDVIQGTGGLRKLRWTDKRRGKGKRGVSGQQKAFLTRLDGQPQGKRLLT